MSLLFDNADIVLPENYSEAVQGAIRKIKLTMASLLIEYDDNDITVFSRQNKIYILANPVVGEELHHDDFGQAEAHPLRNINIILPEITSSKEIDHVKLNMIATLRIIRPELCMRIENES